MYSIQSDHHREVILLRKNWPDADHQKSPIWQIKGSHLREG